MNKEEFDIMLKEEMKKRINTNLNYKNLNYNQLVMVNQYIIDLKLGNYDSIISNVLDYRVTDLLKNKLNLYSRS